MDEIKLKVDYGTAKAGDVFARGTHGVPDCYKSQGYQYTDFFWKVGVPKEKGEFLLEKCLISNALRP